MCGGECCFKKVVAPIALYGHRYLPTARTGNTILLASPSV